MFNWSYDIIISSHIYLPDPKNKQLNTCAIDITNIIPTTYVQVEFEDPDTQ